jgi:hypothetical protein
MTFYQDISDDDFMSAIFSFDLNLQEIVAIEKEYTFKNKATMKTLEESVSRAYSKKVSEPRITYEWTLDDYKKTSADLLDF